MPKEPEHCPTCGQKIPSYKRRCSFCGRMDVRLNYSDDYGWTCAEPDTEECFRILESRRD